MLDFFPRIDVDDLAAASQQRREKGGHAHTGCGGQGSAVYAASGASRVRRREVDALARLLVPLLRRRPLKKARR